MANEPTTQVPVADPAGAQDSLPLGDPPKDAAAAAPEAPVKPDGLDDRFFDSEKGVNWEGLTKEFSELAALKAASDERSAQVPKDGAEYKLEFPEGALPDGVDIDPDDPAWGIARQIGVTKGWTQSDFAEYGAAMAKVIASRETALGDKFAEITKAEAAKLGPNAAQISDSVKQWLTGNFEPEAAKVLEASGVLVNASVVKSLTDTIQALSNAGVTSLNASGRTSPSAIPADWETYTFDQKMAFARQKPAR